MVAPSHCRPALPSPPPPRAALHRQSPYQHPFPDNVHTSIKKQQLLTAVEEGLEQLLPRASTSDLCSLLWAAARLQVQPDDACLAALAAELTRPGYRRAAAAATAAGAVAAAASPVAPVTAVRAAWGGAGSGSDPDGGGAQWQPDAPDDDVDDERRRSHAQAGSRTTSTTTSSSSQQQQQQHGPYSYSRLQLASPRDLGGAAYAFDFFKFNNPAFWAAAAEAALPELPGLRPNHVVTLLTGAAHSSVEAARARLAAAASARRSGGGNGNASLARGPGALAAAPAAAAPAVAELFAAAERLLLDEPRRLAAFRTRDLAGLLAAFATAGRPAPALFAAATRQLLLDDGTGRRLAAMRGRDAALAAWACAHALCADRRLMAALARVLRRRAATLAPHHAALALWAYAATTAGAGTGPVTVDAAMLRALAAAAAGRMHAVRAPVAASVAWSLGRLRFDAPALMEGALDRVAAAMEAADWGGGRGGRGDDGDGDGDDDGEWQQATELGRRQEEEHAAGSSTPGAGRSVLERLLADPSLGEAGGGGGGAATRSGDDDDDEPAPCGWPPAFGGGDDGMGSSSGALDGSGGVGVGVIGGGGGAALLPQDAVHAAWACARLRHWNGAFLAALRRQLPAMLGSGALAAPHVGALLWACARLRYANRAVVGPLCDEVRLG